MDAIANVWYNLPTGSPSGHTESSIRACDCLQAKAQGAQVAPGSASAALQCLWGYPTVQGIDMQPTLLRVGGKVNLLVGAPPDTWGWRAELLADLPTDAPAASPEKIGFAKKWFKYTTQESDRMWIASRAFQGTPPEGP